MTETHRAPSHLLHGLATLTLATSLTLTFASMAAAEEGGNPAHQISIFERLEQERVKATAAEVVPAAMPEPGKSWHDRSAEEWRVYHKAEQQFWIANGGR